MSEKLKPCPFCGCHGVIMTSDEADPQRHTIICEDCPGMADFHSSTAEQAIAAWNRRELESASQPGGGEADTVTVPKEPTEQWCVRLARKSYGAGFTAEKTTLKFCATLIRDVLATAPKIAAQSAGNGGTEGNGNG